MIVIRGLARYLHNNSLGVYSETSASATIFIGRYPEVPDSIIYLREYGGLAPSGGLGYDTVAVQVIIRGEDVNPVPVSVRAQQVYNLLQGLGNTELPDGTYVVGCFAQQPPYPLGDDANGRQEYTLNLLVEVRNQTMHRE